MLSINFLQVRKPEEPSSQVLLTTEKSANVEKCAPMSTLEKVPATPFKRKLIFLDLHSGFLYYSGHELKIFHAHSRIVLELSQQSSQFTWVYVHETLSMSHFFIFCGSDRCFSEINCCSSCICCDITSASCITLLI